MLYLTPLFGRFETTLGRALRSELLYYAALYQF